MTLKDLQRRLRVRVRKLIQARRFTERDLAYRAAMTQSHLSKFLNSRRGMSLESMDRLLQAVGSEVGDLVAFEGISKIRLAQGTSDCIEDVPLVSPRNAICRPHFTARQIGALQPIMTSLLNGLNPDDVCNRSHWTRFVLLKLGKTATQGLWPGRYRTTVLVDRRQNAVPLPDRRGAKLYAIHRAGRCFIGELQLAGCEILMVPLNPQCPVETARLGRARDHADFVIGRVCAILIEV